MKKLFVLAFSLCVMGTVSVAQTTGSIYGPDSLATLQHTSIYEELVNQKNYKEALPSWRYVFNNAPKFRLNTYLKGEEIMTAMFLATHNKAYLDTLSMIYDGWIENFGDHRLGKGFVLGKRAVSLMRFAGDSDENKKKAYNYLMQSFELEGNRSHPVTIQTLFFVGGELLKKNLLTKDEYINLYMKLCDFAEKGMQSSKKEACEQMKRNFDAMFMEAGVADCATLNKLLGASYEANKTDVDNLKKISSFLRRAECTDLPLFATVAEQLYKLDPTADAAYSLSILFLKRQDFDKTEVYLKEAIDKSDDPSAKADYYLRMAQIKLSKNQLPAAKMNLVETLKLNPNSGAALILLGKTYAAYSKNYGQDDFDHASVFWVAVDKFQRAKQVDLSVAEEADRLIAVYSPHFPSKDEAFFRGVTPGASIKIGDWINETTSARFRQ